MFRPRLKPLLSTPRGCVSSAYHVGPNAKVSRCTSCRLGHRVRRHTQCTPRSLSQSSSLSRASPRSLSQSASLPKASPRPRRAVLPLAVQSKPALSHLSVSANPGGVVLAAPVADRRHATQPKPMASMRRRRHRRHGRASNETPRPTRHPDTVSRTTYASTMASPLRQSSSRTSRTPTRRRVV